jgi:predicted DCC family thiol-disulfide oxidoreductase YuxK
MGWVLFFDGDCAFCSAAVGRVARFDKGRRVAFAPLQGKLSAEMGFTKYADEPNGTMVLLRESDSQIFLRGDALIELARALGGAWRVFTVARFVPRSLRDAVYQWVADHRHRIMAPALHCPFPDPELAKRLRE